MKRLIRWIKAKYRNYCTERQIERAAVKLGITDCGLADEVRFSEGQGEGQVRVHSQCLTPARAGITMTFRPQLVYWCYRCEEMWHGTDDGGRGRKPPLLPRQPPPPLGWNTPPEWRESEEVIRNAMRREALTQK